MNALVLTVILLFISWIITSIILAMQQVAVYNEDAKFRYSSTLKTYRTCRRCGAVQFKPKKYHRRPGKKIWLEVIKGVDRNCPCREHVLVRSEEEGSEEEKAGS